MRVLQFVIEGLLQILYRIAGAAFWAQGPAFGAAAFFALAGGSDPAPWVALVRRAALILGAIFVAGGVLLYAISLKSRAAEAPGGSAEPAPTMSRRSVLLRVSLLALSVAALVASRELLSLWREIFVLLDRAGMFHEFAGGGAGSGLVLAPLMVILYAPFLSALSAAALIMLPVLLAIAIAARSPRLGVLFTSAVICCAVLAGAGLVAADLFERLSTMFAPTLRNDADPMGAHVADELRRGSGVLMRAGRAQALVVLCHLAWLPSMLMGAWGAASPVGDTVSQADPIAQEDSAAVS